MCPWHSEVPLVQLRSRSIVVNEECFANLTLDHDHTQHTFAIEQLRVGASLRLSSIPCFHSVPALSLTRPSQVHLAPETAHPAIEGHAHELDRYFKAALEPVSPTHAQHRRHSSATSDISGYWRAGRDGGELPASPRGGPELHSAHQGLTAGLSHAPK